MDERARTQFLDREPAAGEHDAIAPGGGSEQQQGIVEGGACVGLWPIEARGPEPTRPRRPRIAQKLGALEIFRRMKADLVAISGSANRAKLFIEKLCRVEPGPAPRA